MSNAEPESEKTEIDQIVGHRFLCNKVTEIVKLALLNGLPVLDGTFNEKLLKTHDVLVTAQTIDL